MDRCSTPFLKPELKRRDISASALIAQIEARFVAAPLPQLATLERLTTEQKQCLRRCLALVRDRRAVLLCESTGTGKTYVAAGLAACMKAESGIPCAVLAPAHLLPMWREVMRHFELDAQYFSYQGASLGKLAENPTPHCLWLVDEAHSLKSTHTKRYHAFQKHSSQAQICLITASPVSLGYDDLYALLKLCGYPSAPKYEQIQWLRIFAESIIPQSYEGPLTLDALPEGRERKLHYKLSNNTVELTKFMETLLSISWTAVQDGQLGPSLPIIGHHLVDRLLSHRHSCLLSLRRLKRYYDASLKRGQLRLMTRKEFRTIFGIEGQQLPLPFDIDLPPNERELRVHFETVQEKINRCLEILDGLCEGPDKKVQAVQNFVDDLDPKLQIVLFTRYADTAKQFAKILGSSQPVALLTAKEGRYGQSTMPRECLQALFDPDSPLCDTWEAQGLRRPRLLICSDAFSSGHNLQRASVIIHIDKPWNPTINLQRNGRIIRRKQKAKSVILAELVLDDAPAALLNFEERWDRRRCMRQELQNIWLNAIDICLQDILQEAPRMALFCPVNGLHGLWIAVYDRWLPIHPKHAKTLVKSALEPQKTSLAAACELSIPEVKACLEPVWQKIREKRHSPGFSLLIEEALDLLTRLALLPQTECHICSKMTDNGSPEQASLEEIKTLLDMIKVPPANSSCLSFKTYPQYGLDLPTGKTGCLLEHLDRST